MENENKYAIADEKWQTRAALIRNHMKTHDLGAMKAAVEYNLDAGDKQPEFRKINWDNLNGLFKTVTNSPIPVGKSSSYPQVVQDSLVTMSVVYAEGFAALFVSHPLYGEVERARGTAGFTAYTNESYPASKASNFRNRMTGYYDNYVAAQAAQESGEEIKPAIQWDGTLNKKSGLPTLIVPEVEE